MENSAMPERAMSWMTRLSPARPAPPRRRERRHGLLVEALERRALLTVSVLNNGGNGYSALSFNSSGGYVPPDTCGAAGPSSYVETVNQSVALYTNKATGAGAVSDSLSHFLFTTGGLARADGGSGLSDPIVAYDEKIQRFIVGDQDVNFSTHVSTFDLAVSKTSSPGTLSTADWAFYRITTTQAGEDADYPGNFGYNADAFVFTLNMFAVAGTAGTNHVQVVSVNAADLAGAVASPHVYSNNLADFSVRPTTMHDSVAGDPMWLVTEHGDGLSIDVYRMTGVLGSSAAFAGTNLAVTSYSQAVSPRNPNGTTITTNVDSRIIKAAEANNTIVAAHTVAVSSTQDVAQWYAIDVSTGTPTLAQQGRVGAGPNTYITYPGIDINPSGQVGMSYIRSGTDASNDYMSTWVTARNSTDAAGTMQTPVPVPSGSGLANYSDFANPHRAGDLSGINVDPVNGTFWAANEFANTQGTANWGTAVANFAPSAPANSADLAVVTSGPSTLTPGGNATYTVTLTNNGPVAASSVVLTDTLPSGSTLVSATPTAGSDAFTFAQSGGTITESAAAAIASGSFDTFTIVVTVPTGLAAGTTLTNTASVSSTTADPNTVNNTSATSGTVQGPAADLLVTNPGPATASEGDQVVYTATVKNLDATNSATGVVLTDVLGTNLSYLSASTGQGSFSVSGSTVTFSIGTIGPGATVTVSVTARATEDATVTVTATATATSADPNTSNNGATASTRVAEPPIVVSAPITVNSKNANNLTVATFTHAGGLEPASAFAATIDWGDGSTLAGTITQSGAGYNVVGSHRYRGNGNYKVTTTVTEIGQAAELLLAKVGDEVPDLPDHHPGSHSSDHPSPDGQDNQFANQVDTKVSRGTGDVVTIADSRGDFVTLLGQADQPGVAASLSALAESLRARKRGA
jgi:uncharacterized repeat protein (TIGR01451 family)